jgi:hypothetical protein
VREPSQVIHRKSGAYRGSGMEGNGEGKKMEGKNIEGKKMGGNLFQQPSSVERNAHSSALVPRETCSSRSARCFSTSGAHLRESWKSSTHLKTTFDLCLRIGMWRA